jgi:outer membrane protein assembly factor BamA
LLSFAKPNVYTKNNRFYLQGDWRFYLYSQPTYGLGTNSPAIPDSLQDFNFSWAGEGGPDDSIYFPMKFNYVKFHEIVNIEVKENFYAGIGYHLDYYYSIKDEYYRPATDTSLALETPHHYWSNKYGFDSSQYILSGLSANLLYDSRDNQVNSYKGIYANINYRYNFNVLGSNQDASNLWVEFRAYKSLSKKLPRNVLAFWVFGDFNLTGDMPYMTLPALGEDQRARSGRGYTNGRFRGKNIVYGEVEWRFPISRCSQILGGVLFLNATTTDNPNTGLGLFGSVMPGAGVGIRVMVNKYFRTNINLDIAFGKNTSGFYFSGQETF